MKTLHELDSTLILSSDDSFAMMDELSISSEPYFFLISYDLTKVHVHKISDLPSDISFEIEGKSFNPISRSTSNIDLDPEPPTFDQYKIGFDGILEGILKGDSYLCNLTYSVPVDTPHSLDDIYAQARSKYKLKFGDQFICFSPETFITIHGDQIATHPMKGTILLESEKSLEILINDPKERAEHFTVVDLLRNDLGQLCKKVSVGRLRYPTLVTSQGKSLIQLSTEIKGQLREDIAQNHGYILRNMLPAGSISGAPKKSTVALIQENENHDRGYYTGVFGYFDGSVLRSSVNIRFVEKTASGMTYKTGGGITYKSDAREEYQEILNKIYVPVY